MSMKYVLILKSYYTVTTLYSDMRPVFVIVSGVDRLSYF